MRNADCGMRIGSDETDAVSLNHVSFTYADAATPALRGVSLQVRQGEMIIIIGASGAGKSTLAKCLNRVIPDFQTGQLSVEVWLCALCRLSKSVVDLPCTGGMV